MSQLWFHCVSFCYTAALFPVITPLGHQHSYQKRIRIQRLRCWTRSGRPLACKDCKTASPSQLLLHSNYLLKLRTFVASLPVHRLMDDDFSVRALLNTINSLQTELLQLLSPLLAIAPNWELSSALEVCVVYQIPGYTNFAHAVLLNHSEVNNRDKKYTMTRLHAISHNRKTKGRWCKNTAIRAVITFLLSLSP